ncbi:MAG: hypothetical protein SGILL_007207, partial [Bacillariaceae sp.]
LIRTKMDDFLLRQEIPTHEVNTAVLVDTRIPAMIIDRVDKTGRHRIPVKKLVSITKTGRHRIPVKKLASIAITPARAAREILTSSQ